MVAGAVLFGLLGPRMGQRGMRIHGIPATTLQAAVLAVLDGEIDEFIESGIRWRKQQEAAPA
jgi:hypothetical protein